MKEQERSAEQVGWIIMAQRARIEAAAADLFWRVWEEQKAKGLLVRERFAEADRQAGEFKARQYRKLRQEYADDSLEIQSWIP